MKNTGKPIKEGFLTPLVVECDTLVKYELMLWNVSNEYSLCRVLLFGSE